MSRDRALPPGAGERHPLSFAQEQMWLIDNLYQGDTAYNLTLAFRIRGTVDADLLERALGAVVDHHEVLRASFAADVDALPYQTLAAEGGVTLARRDVRGDEETIARVVREHGAAAFDLSTGPLHRFSLLRIAEDHHVFVLTVHHIVIDGWSMGIVLRDTADAYAALLAGREPALPTLPMRYVDFARRQRVELDEGTLEEQLQYWQGQLAGLPTLDLPADRHRPTEPTMNGDTVFVEFPAAVAQALRESAAREFVSVFAPLVAATQVVLACYTGESDIPVGVTMLGRPEPELERLVGLFVNMVVIRTDLTEDPTLSEVMGRTADTLFDAYDNDQVSFEKVVARLAPKRDASRNPLFQVAVQLLDAQNAGEDFPLPGVTTEPVRTLSKGSRFDISLNFAMSGEKLRLDVEYSTDLFDRWRIEALAAHLGRVLTAFAEEPRLRLSQLSLPSAEERERILAFGRGEPSSRADETVHAAVTRAAAADPDAIAAVCGGRRLTYGELIRGADDLARRLRLLGVRHEQIVAVALDRDVDVPVALLGVLKAGAAYTVIDVAQPPARLAYMLDDTRAPVVVTRSALVGQLPPLDGRHVLCLDAPGGPLGAAAADEPLAEWATRDSLLYVLYTSGSTGRPKGVLLEHRALLSFLESYRRNFELGPDSRMLHVRALPFDIAHGEIFAALTAGATVVFVPEDVLASPDQVARIIREERVTYIGVPPWMLALVDAGPYPDLRSIMNGGETVLGELVNKWNLPGRRFVNAYGPTEAAVSCTAHVCEYLEWLSPPPVGGPDLDRRLYVVDRSGNPVPIGVPGELLVGGEEGLARGYLNEPELTARAFVPDPFVPGGRVYRTGDLARWNPDGRLEFIGRRDNQVKLRGVRIELEEIEAVLVTHPDIALAAVGLRTDPRGEQYLVGYLTTTGEHRPTPTELREHVTRFLPLSMLPSAWLFLDAFPMTAVKKIDRAALPHLELPTDHVQPDRVVPRTPTEAEVARIFATVLEVPEVGADANLFDLGGNSLEAMRVISRLNERFGVRTKMRSLYGTTTVATLAAQLDELVAGAGEGAPPGGPPPAGADPAGRQAVPLGVGGR